MRFVSDGNGFDLEQLRVMPSDAAGMKRTRKRPQRVPKTDRKSLFLKGPIPWTWISAAGRLPGKALHVAVALQMQVAMARGVEVRLSGDRLHEIGVDRHSAYRALKALEEAGLASVKRHRGRSPVVTLLDAPPHASAQIDGGAK